MREREHLDSHLNSQRWWAAIAILLCLCFVAGSVLFLMYMERQHMKENLEFLDNAARQHKTAVIKQVEGDLQTLHGVAVFVGEQDITELEQLARLMGAVNEGNVFIRMGFATPDGSLDLIELGGKRYQGLDVSTEEFFQEALAGRDIISVPVSDPFREGEYVNYYAVPVRNQGGHVIGVLCAVNDAAIIRKILDAPLLNGTGSTDLYDSSGNLILRSIHTAVSQGQIPFLDELPGLTEEGRTAIRATLAGGDPAHFTHSVEGRTMLAVLESVGVADWFVLSSVSMQELRQRYILTAVGAVATIVAACALFLLLLFQQYKLMSRNQVTMERLAYVDELTGGRNYNKFLMDAELSSKAEEQRAVWYCDLKKFKYYNDALGYHMGDELLRRIYRLFSRTEGPEGLFCRMSADNFVGLRAYGERGELTQWFERLLEELHREESQEVSRFYLELCMGFYCPEADDSGLTVNEMVNRANMAQKSIKERTGSGYAFYDDELRRLSLQESVIEVQGKKALDEGQFHPYFQPKFNIQNGNRLSGAEVLCRWVNPEKGMIPPDKFIPTFEKSGLIVQLDRYMFRQACAWYRSHLDRGGARINLAINVSRVGLLREDFVEYYIAVKEEFGLPDGVLEIEVTESLAIGGEELLVQLVRQLQSHGFICSLDDFGSGYSSLNLLKNLPIDVLKLDILFFHRSVDRNRERIVVRNIINMARELRIRVIAEGVEDQENVEFLRDAGCDIVQGYVFAKPMPLREFEQLLQE